MVLGVAACFQLGQDEDPPFTFRAMVVQAFWPGATAQQIAEQVTDKIERTLQEVPQADTIRSSTRPGESLTIIELKDSAPPKEVGNSGYQCSVAFLTAPLKPMRLGVWLGANRSDTEVSRGFATTPRAQRRDFKRRIACNTAPGFSPPRQA